MSLPHGAGLTKLTASVRSHLEGTQRSLPADDSVYRAQSGLPPQNQVAPRAMDYLQLKLLACVAGPLPFHVVIFG